MSDRQRKKINYRKKAPCADHKMSGKESGSSATLQHAEFSPEFNAIPFVTAMSLIDVDKTITFLQKMKQFFLYVKKFKGKIPHKNENSSEEARIVIKDDNILNIKSDVPEKSTNHLNRKIINNTSPLLTSDDTRKSSVLDGNTNPIKDSNSRLDMIDYKPSKNFPDKNVNFPQSKLTARSISELHSDATAKENNTRNGIPAHGSTTHGQRRNRGRMNSKFNYLNLDKTSSDKGNQNESKEEFQDTRGIKGPTNKSASVSTEKFRLENIRRYPSNLIPRCQGKEDYRKRMNDDSISSCNLASTPTRNLKSQKMVETKTNSRAEKNIQLYAENNQSANGPYQGQYQQHQSFQPPNGNWQQVLVPHQAQFQEHQSLPFPTEYRQLEEFRSQNLTYQETLMPLQQPPYYATENPFPTYNESPQVQILPGVNYYQSYIQLYVNGTVLDYGVLYPAYNNDYMS